VQAAIEVWGRVDIVANNAYTGKALKRLRVEWRDAAAATSRSTRWPRSGRCARGVPAHARPRGGSIINTCSLNGANAHMFTAEYNVGEEPL
jgi:NAD(P)-dependent dehydrogenase (short-subunit alcohol dehydrogenase family)